MINYFSAIIPQPEELDNKGLVGSNLGMTYQDDSKAPEVAGLIVTLLAGSQGSVKHLRGCIGQGEAGRQHPTLHLWLQPGKPKVDHLELGILSSGVKQEVLGLEVPVHHPEAVHVIHNRDEFRHDSARLCLGELPFSLDPLEELAALEELSDDIGVTLVHEDLD